MKSRSFRPLPEADVYSAIVDAPIDVAAILQRVARDANGAVVLFLGTVRDVNDGRGVRGIEYTAYRSMAQRELATIVEEAAALADSNDIAVEHRLGQLAIGECSVAIAVAHPHRERAFEAARYVIEEIKQRVPIWKREQYVDGTREWVRASSASTEDTSNLVDVGEAP
jgi:molybdopterin synthase catalytic subunit